jgi:VanZ family protein
MVPILVSAAVLALLLIDLARAGRSVRRPTWEIVLRAAPFFIAGTLSIFVAGQAPKGRHPFRADLSLSPEDLARSMTKVPHFRSMAILFLLAVVAFGVHRLLLAFVATMLVGVGWELAEATVVGHYARLADLAPNLVAGLGTLLLAAMARFIFERRRARALLPLERR